MRVRPISFLSAICVVTLFLIAPSHRGNAELGALEFRAEFFNILNMVNFGLPSNLIRGSGFGIISKTASPSRQIQFSLKVIYQG